MGAAGKHPATAAILDGWTIWTMASSLRERKREERDGSGSEYSSEEHALWSKECSDENRPDRPAGQVREFSTLAKDEAWTVGQPNRPAAQFERGGARMTASEQRAQLRAEGWEFADEAESTAAAPA